MTARSRLTLPVLLAATSLTVMAGATIAPSLPGLKDHFAATPNIDILVRLALTAPALAIAIAAPLAGGVADRIGRKPVLLAGIALYVLAGASGLVLDDIWSILIGRLLLGAAVGMIMTTSSALLGDLYHGEARERALRWQSAAMGYAGVLFLMGGGLLAELSWRGPFAVYLAPLLLIPLILASIAEPPAQPRPDMIAAFPWRQVAFIYFIAFLGMLIFYIVPVQLPFLLRELGAPSPTLAGAGIATGSILSATSSLFLLAPIRTRLTSRQTLILSFSMMAAGYVLIWLSPSWRWVFAGLSVYGLGLGLQMPPLASWLQQLATPAARGKVMGGFTTALFLGQFVSPFVHGPSARLFGYGGSYLVAAGLAAATVILLLAWKKRPSAP